MISSRLRARPIVAALCALSLWGCAGRSRSFDYAAEREPRALPRNPRPEYPPSLVRERLTGTVRMRILVTDSGSVDTSSVEVLEATHPLFEESARRVLPRLKFLPAETGGNEPTCRTDPIGRRLCSGGKRGRPVAQHTVVEFQFVPPATDDDSEREGAA